MFFNVTWIPPLDLTFKGSFLGLSGGELIPFFYRLLHHERAYRSYFMFTSYDCFSTGRHIINEAYLYTLELKE